METSRHVFLRMNHGSRMLVLCTMQNEETIVLDIDFCCSGMLNASENKSFRVKDLNLKTYQKKVMGSDERGVNAMSLSDITGIPTLLLWA